MQGTVHALKTIATSEGASGLFRGFWPTVLSNAPFSAVYYMLYSDLRKRFQRVQRLYYCVFALSSRCSLLGSCFLALLTS